MGTATRRREGVGVGVGEGGWQIGKAPHPCHCVEDDGVGFEALCRWTPRNFQLDRCVKESQSGLSTL